MDREKALEELRALQEPTGDTEIQHVAADRVLTDLLISLGYLDVVTAWRAVPKWYA